MKKLFALAIMAFAILTINAQEVGNQDSKTDSRTLAEFEQVVVNANFNVNIVNSVTRKVEVEAESNLQQYIVTEVKGKTLNIGLAKKAKISPSLPITINISLPTISKLQYTGDGNVSLDGARSDKMELTLNGKGTCTVNNFQASSNLKFTATDGFNVTFTEAHCGSSKIAIEGNSTISFSRLTSSKIELDFASATSSSFTATQSDNSITIRHKGAGNIEFSGFAGKEINATMTNTGTIKMGGSASSATVTVSNAAAFDALALQAEKAKITNGSTGDVSIGVTSSLDATITSTGSINYKGYPKIKLENTSKGQLVNKN